MDDERFSHERHGAIDAIRLTWEQKFTMARAVGTVIYPLLDALSQPPELSGEAPDRTLLVVSELPIPLGAGICVIPLGFLALTYGPEKAFKPKMFPLSGWSALGTLIAVVEGIDPTCLTPANGESSLPKPTGPATAQEQAVKQFRHEPAQAFYELHVSTHNGRHDVMPQAYLRANINSAMERFNRPPLQEGRLQPDRDAVTAQGSWAVLAFG
ncbi:MAG: hypothetical protein JWR68_1661 [Polaromonas sp.]|nr:hypothetical protein [Polaromonas sp.]